MSIAIFEKTPFGDENAFADFLGAHYIEHQTIASKLAASGILIRMVPLGDSPVDSRDWMLDHYQIHKDISSHAGGGIPDFSAFDLTDEKQYADWMRLHTAVHVNINAQLGIFT